MALSLRMTRARTAVFSIAVLQNGAPLNVTGKTLYFTAKFKVQDADAAAVVKKSTGSGIVVTDAPNGLATLTINPADTAALAEKNTQRLVCDVALKDGANVYELDSGTLDVAGNVTQDTP